MLKLGCVHEHYMMTMTMAVVTGLLIISLLSCICRYVKWKYKPTEEQRVNSFLNKTYVTNNQDNAECYDLLSEVECPETFRPELPARNRELTTIDCYSEPADAVKEANATSDYNITYDDPIRALVKTYNANESKKRYDIENLNERRVESFKHKHRILLSSKPCNDNLKDKETHVICHTDEDKSTEKVIEPHEDIDELNAYNLLENINAGSGNANCDDDGGGKVTVANGKARYVACERESKDCKNKHQSKPDEFNDYDDSICTLNGIGERRAVSANIKASKISICSDYEDTGDLLPVRSMSTCDLFSEHICLDCLTPAHLKKLGIRIVMEDNLNSSYSYQNLPRSFSDSDLTSYYNLEKVNRSSTYSVASESVDNSDEPRANHTDSFKVDHKKRKSVPNKLDVQVSDRNDNTWRMNACQFNRSRKCSRCNESIYDTLGKPERQATPYIINTEYSKLADIRYLRPNRYRCCVKKSPW